MSLAVPYENVDDAQMRLQNTVVLYDGEPVYITSVANVGPDDPKGNIFRVYAVPLPYAGNKARDKNEFRKFITSNKFDMAPFPMGFVNIDGTTVYCSRLPRRQQRQGLCDRTLSALSIGNMPAGMYGFAHLIGRQEFVDCIKGKYPAFDEARRMIDHDKAKALAFTRNFALVSDTELPELIYLYHKKDKVGFIMGDDVTLSKTGRCLVESLREAGVKC